MPHDHQPAVRFQTEVEPAALDGVDNDCRQDQAKHRPGGVHGPVQAEAPAPLVDGRGIGDEGVTRRGAHTLAEAVAEAHAQHGLPGRGQQHERLDSGRKAIAQHGQQLALPKAVGEAAADQPENGVEALG